MHPAPSVILFTSLSGVGFGLLFWLGFSSNPPTGWAAFFWFALAYALSVGGLMASTFHLGHPERALKAFTQWKSSWLSREAWTSVVSLLLLGGFAVGLIFFGTHWPVLGWVGGLFALLTVFTTSMIYTQLKTVPRWNQASTPLLFLGLAITGGALVFGLQKVALLGLILSACLQLIHWVLGDRRLTKSGSTLASATQLTGGTVRAFEPPHTGSNYLTREMIFVVGRKHRVWLRIIAFVLGFAVPILGVILGLPMLLCAVIHFVGICVSRWLFFAEAEHVVGLYYGKR